jgi:hypothetical protein
MRIVVLGYIIRGPLGGQAWHHLQYVLGLIRLGHEVRFIEDSDDYPGCYDPSRYVIDCDPSYGLRFAADAFGRHGLGDHWAYHDAHSGRWLGPACSSAQEFCRTADVLLNVSAVNPLRDWALEVPVRVLVDTDPVFTQVRHLTDDAARRRALDHNVFFTFAENVRRGTAELPNDGFEWRATRQPIVLDVWPVTPAPPAAPYTTVMHWQSYRPLEYAGKWYGTKSASFQRFLDLPRRATVPLEIALGGDDAPLEMLGDKGWKLVNPLEVALTPEDFQDYVRASRGELAVAKQGYVVSNSGWFSERSAGYLASGRPVVTQETGFSEWLPLGCGLFSFREADEALDALERIEKDYDRNAIAARNIAEEHFESGQILSRLLEEASAASSSSRRRAVTNQEEAVREHHGE